MTHPVRYECRDGIGLITIDSPPVNALGAAVRAGLLAALETGLQDPQAGALVLTGGGRTFPAGADIREFGRPPAEPMLPQVIDRYEASDKLTVAAIHGTALGGGLELALGCDYRIALNTAKVGLPEVKLGLLPGAGGTQRLPRLIGADAALPIIAEGNPVAAERAKALGIVDEVVADGLIEAALAYARRLLDTAAPRRPLRAGTAALTDPQLFAHYEAAIARKQRGFLAPLRCIEAVRAAVELPFDDGVARERALFVELMASPQSKAQRHVFFAEREVARVPGMAADTPKRPIRRVAVLGAGTMGGGIAMNFANAGIPVRLLEVEQAALDRGLEVIRRNYENTAKKGRISAADVERRMALIQPTLSYDDLADADLVIEAVFENMDIKKQVFKRLDAVCKPGAILASNTSTLNIDEIAAVTRRPQDVMGMHFFSPANVMKLLENVRGANSADDVVATVMDLSRRIGKVGVCVGVCYGFVGNRMLHKRQQQAIRLVEEGASPERVDRVLHDFGMPMGPFAMSDLAGLDVGYRIREELRKAGDPEAQAPSWLDKIAANGRYGQKTGAGVFRYADGDRTPRPDPEVEALIAAHRRERGITPRAVDDHEILERCLFVMINEGARILEEGIAARPHDIDIVWIYGYGFPVYRGGPMFWADQVGLRSIFARMTAFQQRFGDRDWQPAPLLQRLATADQGFYSTPIHRSSK